MTGKIEVEITYTAEDYARSAKYMLNRQFLAKHSLLITYAIFGCIFLFVYLTNPAKFGVIFTNPLLLLPFVIPLAILTVWWFFQRNRPSYFLRRNIEKQFATSPALREPKLISFDDEGIYGASQFGAGLTKWEAFIEAAETGDDLYFFTSTRFAQFVPKRFFAEEELRQIRNLAARRLGEKAKLLQ